MISKFINCPNCIAINSAKNKYLSNFQAYGFQYKQIGFEFWLQKQLLTYW